ncbi:MFS transporter, partial [Streptomyces sp. t39]|uniref:MFS transporter n=1 Tax=Streptomyces sp. t39 TaxID=1828156 RepID=UPI0011CE58D6
MATPQQPTNTTPEASTIAEKAQPPTPEPRPVPDGWLRFWATAWDVLAALWTGSSRISSRIGAFISGGSTGGALARILGLVLAAGFIYGLPFTWRILGLTTLAWVVLALRIAYRPGRGRHKQDDQEQPAKAPKRTISDVTRDETVTALHALLQASGGVHLKTLGKHLTKELGGGPVRTREVRDLLTRHGIRHRAGVRLPGESGREGVHRDDVPPLPS